MTTHFFTVWISRLTVSWRLFRPFVGRPYLFLLIVRSITSFFLFFFVFFLSFFFSILLYRIGGLGFFFSVLSCVYFLLYSPIVFFTSPFRLAVFAYFSHLRQSYWKSKHACRSGEILGYTGYRPVRDEPLLCFPQYNS